jgi:hypothetical protein
MSEDLNSLSPLQMHQMVFIYNAVMHGWTVRLVEQTGNFHFKRRIQNSEERKHYQQDGFLQRFLQNMQKLQIVETQIQSFELRGDQM